MSEATRATDPNLTTRDCAERLGVSTGFIIGEIRDGRLKAMVIERKGFRTIYRVADEELQVYLREHRWNLTRATDAPESAKRPDRT